MRPISDIRMAFNKPNVVCVCVFGRHCQQFVTCAQQIRNHALTSTESLVANKWPTCQHLSSWLSLSRWFAAAAFKMAASIGFWEAHSSSVIVDAGASRTPNMLLFAIERAKRTSYFVWDLATLGAKLKIQIVGTARTHTQNHIIKWA